MGVLFTPERRQWIPEPFVPPYPGYGGSSTSVTNKEQAMANSTVWSCVGTIANSISLMALETFSGVGDVPTRVTDPSIVISPSAGTTQSEFLHQVMVSLLLRGNAYSHIVGRDGRMRPNQLELLDPDTVMPRMVDGQIEYWVKAQQIPTADMWHIRGMTLPGCKVGMSPIAYGALAMGVELSAAKFARDFFDGGGIPKAILTSDLEVTQQQARTLKERLLAATQDREPMVLGSGVKYQTISVRPDESQFIATLENAVSTVARFFFMPPEMVGGSSGKSMTYTNRVDRALDFATYCMGFWMKRLEDAYFPILPQPWYVKFNEENLLRNDPETEAKVFVTYVAGKVLPPSRILRKIGEKPLSQDEKEQLELVPLTVTPNGQPKALPKPPSPETSPDTPDLTPEG